jgi:hypothetical protein
MGWVINIDDDMVQFIIKIAAVKNTATDVTTDIPSNFQDFDVKHFETFDEIIQTSGALSTVLLTMIKYRSTISTHFTDFNKKGLETQEEIDELVTISMFVKFTYKFKGFVDVLNRTFIDY